MKTDRPVALNLFKFRWPLAAMVSITHRVTGAVLFVGVAFGIYVLDLALSSAAGFDAAARLMETGLAKLIMLGLLFVLIYHIVAGIKHLLLDFHIGDTLQGVFAGSLVVIVASIVSTVLLGAALW